MTILPFYRLIPAIGLGVLISACSSDKRVDIESPEPDPTITVSLNGTAAVGQAIVNATITATCQNGSGFTVSPVVTDDKGKWSGEVDSQQLPCLLELAGGEPDIQLSSMAFSAGTVNITPLTHLSLIKASADANLAWKDNVAMWPNKNQIEAAASSVLDVFESKNYIDEELVGSPFSTEFEADGTGWDRLLDNILTLVSDSTNQIDDYQSLGQILINDDLERLPVYTSTTPTEPTEPTPNEELLNQLNGIAFTLDGHTWIINQPFIPSSNYQSTNRHIRANNFIGDVILDESSFKGDELAWAQVTLAHGLWGKQNCSADTGLTLLTVNNDGEVPVQKIWSATECELQVDYHIGNGASEGRIVSAKLVNDKDQTEAVLTDGQFRIFVHPGKTGEVPTSLADDVWMSVAIDKGTAELKSGYFLMSDKYSTKLTEDGSHPDHQISISLDSSSALESREPGSYTCGVDPISSVNMTLKMGFNNAYVFSTKNGGDSEGKCSFNIDSSSGRKFEGSYTATLIAQAANNDIDMDATERTITISGRIRNFITQAFVANNNGNEGDLATDVAGLSMKIEEGNTHFIQGQSFLLVDDLSETSGHIVHYEWKKTDEHIAPLRMTFSGLPLSVGSYVCNEIVGDQQLSMSLGTNVNIPYSTSFTQGGVQQLNDGASCSVDVTNIGTGSIEGTYTATLVARNVAPMLPEQDATISISGKFRHFYTEDQEPTEPDPIDPAPTDPSDPTPKDPEPGSLQEPIGKAVFGDNASPTSEEFIALVSNTWPVAIYQVPDSNPEWYGKGSLTISGTSNSWNMELRGADNSVISSLNSSNAFTNALTPFYKQDLGVLVVYQPGQIFINKGTDITQYMTSFFYQNSGLIEGSAGGNAEVKFRNSVEAYGTGVPDIFNTLAGTWTANVNVYCDGPFGAPTAVTNTATITNGGVITLDGKTQLCGNTLPQTFAWEGLNDFLIIDPEENDGSYIMQIDAQNLTKVGNGKIQIRFNPDMTVKSISGFLPELFELKGAVKQSI
ncbi:hypothetical protein DS2_09397 [Catenovulum agarivorans DS-2]|uniref:Uncharacterized protein n=1 Tax=Catenovulum agarivorans DS-2 TaxID=1328313 RepID=W7QXX9_9ALTE|nr:hypothetical protein [Catenovulum agarivorans]EWH10150.1 hypothetical protein DS2_09397 [Catenovulum agarivorans DS-2]